MSRAGVVTRVTPQAHVRNGEGLFSTLNQLAGAMAVAWRCAEEAVVGALLASIYHLVVVDV